MKKHFPFLQSNQLKAYCDSAATSHKPQAVIEAIDQFYRHEYASVHRALYDLAEQATQRYEGVREQIARWIGARSAREIVFTSGATESINVVATGWARERLQAGDQIVVSILEHHANLVPWQQVCQKTGAELRVVPLTDDERFDMNAYRQALSNKTKLVALTHASNVLGTTIDVKTVVDHARNVGARVLIDACQSVPHQRIDVQKIGCDFLVFSGHKMMGPTGVGVLYLREELHDEVTPYRFGGNMISEVTPHSASWADAPAKFEAGTPPIAQVIGLGAALDFMQEHLDFQWLHTHEAALCTQLIEGLDALPRIRILGPVDELKKRGHLVSFSVDGVHPHDVAAYLGQQGIAVRAGHHCAMPLHKALGIDASVRVSFYCYNDAADVDVVLAALNTLPF